MRNAANFGKGFGFAAVVWITFVIVIWIAVIWVAVHFIRQWW